MLSAAAIIYLCATLVVTLFQLALAAGAPWGHLAMGGAVKGAFPPRLRVAALAQAGLLTALAYILCRHSGLIGDGPVFGQPRAAWAAVAFAGMAVVLNTITPSRAERRLWLPIALVMFASSLAVAKLGGSTS